MKTDTASELFLKDRVDRWGPGGGEMNSTLLVPQTYDHLLLTIPLETCVKTSDFTGGETEIQRVQMISLEPHN